MGIVDRWIRKRGYIRKAEARRPVYVTNKSEKRVFDAAEISRLTSSWLATDVSINEDLKNNYKILVTRGRDLSKNDDFVKRFLRLVKSNVIGPKGITLQARIGGKNQSKSANEAVEMAWGKWGQFGSPEVTGRYGWRDIQRAYIEGIARDGEFFAVKHRGMSVRNPYRFALQLIDPLAVDVEMNEDQDGRLVKLGIELDAQNRAIAYWVLDDTGTARARNGRQYTRIPARNMIHGFMPEFPDQLRGFSGMSSAMLRLNHLKGYEEAAIVGARVAASKMGTYETSADGAPWDGASGQDALGELSDEVEPGVLEKLPPGVTLNALDFGYPPTDYAQFVKAILRGAASGLGVSYHALSNDLEDVNFSSIRAGVLEDREEWKSLQEFVISALCRPVFEEWVDIQVGLGLLKVGKGQTVGSSRVEEFKQATWQPRRWAWVDPLKEAQAVSLELKNRLISRGSVIRDKGVDPDDVWAETKAELEKLDKLGIPPEETNSNTASEKS